MGQSGPQSVGGGPQRQTPGAEWHLDPQSGVVTTTPSTSDILLPQLSSGHQTSVAEMNSQQVG